MRVYVDSSALIKRSVAEAESDALEEALQEYLEQGAAIVTSVLASMEVGRALLRLTEGVAVQDALDDALAGVAERPMGDDVVGLARRIRPPVLRTLDAIHLATAFLLDVDVVITYDIRLAEACQQNELRTSAPGRR